MHLDYWKKIFSLREKNSVRMIDWLIDWSIGRLIDWLINWSIDRSIDWLIDWLISWLIDWLSSKTAAV